MPIIKQNRTLSFAQLDRGAPFAATITLYTQSDGAEDPKEHFFYKLNAHKATTLDKRIRVYFGANDLVTLCRIEARN